MNKDIFVSLCDRLEKEVPSLRWIDEDLGQLVDLKITLKLAFPYQGESYNKAPEKVREKALDRYAVISEVHDCLQGWTADEIFSPLSRRSGRPSVMAGGIKTYTLVYGTTFEEYQ